MLDSYELQIYNYFILYQIKIKKYFKCFFCGASFFEYTGMHWIMSIFRSANAKRCFKLSHPSGSLEI